MINPPAIATAMPAAVLWVGRSPHAIQPISATHTGVLVTSVVLATIDVYASDEIHAAKCTPMHSPARHDDRHAAGSFAGPGTPRHTGASSSVATARRTPQITRL
jgi:hypothetical protein